MTDRDELVVRGTPLARIVGLTGLVGAVLLFAGLIAGSPGEPPVNATVAVWLWLLTTAVLLTRRHDLAPPENLANGT